MSSQALGLLALSLSLAAPTAALAAPPVNSPQPRIDLVIALDTSGSMRGLIDATRTQLWNAVRLLSRAQPQPQVRVGLITFGNRAHDPAAGWVRRELDLSSDLDAVSAQLFALTARGSNEYVARAVQTATRRMSWDQSPSTLKILFVAGNESATQDPRVGLSTALAEARQRGILVNAIFCGRPEVREAQGWRVLASAGGGQFAAIDHTRALAARSTPYDAQLAALSRELSRTYVAFGADGARYSARQAGEDARAAADGLAVAAERAAAKATPNYDNMHWDVIDAAQKREKMVGLPPELAAMSEAQRQHFIATRAEQRQRVQAQITQLAARRDAYLAASSDPTIDSGSSIGSGATVGGGLRTGAGAGRANGSSSTPFSQPTAVSAVTTVPVLEAPVGTVPVAGVRATTAPVATVPVGAVVASAPPAAATPAVYSDPPARATDSGPAVARAQPAKRTRAPAARAPRTSQGTMQDAFSGTLRQQAEMNGYAF